MGYQQSRIEQQPFLMFFFRVHFGVSIFGNYWNIFAQIVSMGACQKGVGGLSMMRSNASKWGKHFLLCPFQPEDPREKYSFLWQQQHQQLVDVQSFQYIYKQIYIYIYIHIWGGDDEGIRGVFIETSTDNGGEKFEIKHTHINISPFGNSASSGDFSNSDPNSNWEWWKVIWENLEAMARPCISCLLCVENMFFLRYVPACMCVRVT